MGLEVERGGGGISGFIVLRVCTVDRVSGFRFNWNQQG